MLDEATIAAAADVLVDIFASVETSILTDAAKRLRKLGDAALKSDTDAWRALLLSELGGLKSDVNKTLKGYSAEVVAAVKKAYSSALQKSAEADAAIFEKATGRTVSASYAQSVSAAIKSACADLSRLTSTTAAAQSVQFVNEANKAFLQVQSGAFSLDEALKSSVDSLASAGMQTVIYENGRTARRSIESAVRMNIATGVNRAAAAQTLDNCAELECDLVETSAHIGARPEHEAWQGQVFSLSGKSDKYPRFDTATRYGEPDGICGVNCRHSFYPFFEGLEESYTKRELNEMSAERVTYDGQEMTRYEAEQTMRANERKIREYKRRALAEEAAGLDSTQARLKLGEWQERARDFSKQTGVTRDYTRERVGVTAEQSQPRGISAGTLQSAAQEVNRLDDKTNKTVAGKPKRGRRR